MIQAATYHSEAELRANAKAIRDRLLYGGRKVASANQNAPAVKRDDVRPFVLPSPPPRREESPVKLIVKYPPDAHMEGWPHWKAALNAKKPGQFIRHACKAFGIEHSLLMSINKTKRVYFVRKTLIEMVKKRHPKLSNPQMGKLFNRDPSTLVHALGRKVTGAIRVMTPDLVREVRRRHQAGESIKGIAESLGMVPNTIRLAIHEITWSHVK